MKFYLLDLWLNTSTKSRTEWRIMRKNRTAVCLNYYILMRIWVNHCVLISLLLLVILVNGSLIIDFWKQIKDKNAHARKHLNFGLIFWSGISSLFDCLHKSRRSRLYLDDKKQNIIAMLSRAHMLIRAKKQNIKHIKWNNGNK